MIKLALCGMLLKPLEITIGHYADKGVWLMPTGFVSLEF